MVAVSRVGQGLEPAVTPEARSPERASAPQPAAGGDQIVRSLAMRQQAMPAKALHFVFVSDIHANMPRLHKFVDSANARQPELIIDGGDRVHNGTESEFRRTHQALQRLDAPYYEVEGNHDAKPVGHFHGPKPAPPEFQSFDRDGVHFILVDNSKEAFSDAVFAATEADLKANQDKTIIVAMHVPVVLKNETAMIRAAKYLPINAASPRIHDDAQVERFTTLMSRYRVAAVLSGHTHYPDEVEVGGVKYIVAGAAGGQLPGVGIDHEYLDIHVRGRVVDVQRVKLDQRSKNPAAYAYHLYRDAADINTANHAEGGWDYNPRESAQLKASHRYSRTDHGTSTATGVTASMETARMHSGKGGFVGEVTVAGGQDELSADLTLGYKYRPIGGYNRGVYVSGAVGANGGIIADEFSAGIGARGAVGAEYKRLTLEMGHEFATNRSMTYAGVGYRF